MVLQGPYVSPVRRQPPPFEADARRMLGDLNRAVPHLEGEDIVAVARNGMELLQKLPSGNLKRLGIIAGAALAAAGNGPLGVAVARTALKALQEDSMQSPAQLGYRLMGPVQKAVRRGEPVEKEARATAEAIFRSVAPAYSIHPKAVMAVGEGDLMVRVADCRATVPQRLNAVSRAMGKLSKLPDDLALLEESMRGPGSAGKIGDLLVVGGEIQKKRSPER